VTGVIGNLIIWAISLALLFVSARCLSFVLRKSDRPISDVDLHI
jgi:hypothetical protein